MKKIVNYKVNGKEWNEAKTRAFTKLSKKIKVDGFREGKVPRSVFEKKFGTGDIISEAMEEMVQEKYAKTIMEDKLVPVVEPKLEIVKADDEGFEVNMTFVLDPEVKLGKYKELKVKKDKFLRFKKEWRLNFYVVVVLCLVMPLILKAMIPDIYNDFIES